MQLDATLTGARAQAQGPRHQLWAHRHLMTQLGRAALQAWMLAVLGLFSIAASAQTTSSGAATASASAQVGNADVGTLSEITIEATKRKTSLEDTPISVTALSSADIERNRVVSIVDVEDQAPQLTYLPLTGSETYLSLRGAATIDDSSGTDQPVVMYVDGIARVSVADLQPDVFDTQRVEVLNGPQGTLFGENAVGGLVAIYTNDPTFDPERTLELTYGRYNLVEVNAMLNVPLTDTVAARLVVSRRTNDGYIRDDVTHTYAGNSDTLAARGKLLFKPSDDLRFVAGFDYLNKRGTDANWMIGNFQPSLDPGISFSPTQTSQGVPSTYFQRNWGFTGQLDWHTSVGDLTSISGYRRVQAQDLGVHNGDPLAVETVGTTSDDSQISQEIRLASPTDQKLTWLTGVYFLHRFKSRPIDFNVNLIPGSFAESTVPSPGFPNNLVLFREYQDTSTKNYAVFADGTYAFTDKWKLEVGGRYTRETKSGHSAVNLANLFAGPAIDVTYSDSWSAFTPKATLSYQPTAPLLTYVTVSRGFQSGGFNVGGNTPGAFQTPFDSEFVTNYEAGVKLDTLNHRLHVNVDVFTEKYTNMQVVQFSGVTFITTNAGKADVDGLESTFDMAATKWLTLGLNYNYLHSKYTNYVVNNGPGVAPTVYTGNHLPFSPPQSATARAELHFPAPKLHGSVAFGGDYTYRSPTWFDVANDTPKDVYDRSAWDGVINLHASWTSESDRWQVLLWGKNVTAKYFSGYSNDESYYVLSPTESNDPSLHLFDGRVVDPPWFGVTVKVNF